MRWWSSISVGLAAVCLASATLGPAGIAQELVPAEAPIETPAVAPTPSSAQPEAAESPPAPRLEPMRRMALLIASNDGGRSRVPLRYAVTDAEAVADVLTELGGVSAADQIVVVEPTRTQIREAFRRMKAKVRDAKRSVERTEVVVYYSGHSDEDGVLTAGERTTYPELKDAMSDLGADVLVAILDSCSSGALLRGKGGVRKPPFAVDRSNYVVGRAFLTSSSADEVAQESDRLGASFFTHHLISGLRGAADMSGDGQITLNEAYQYAFHETLARTERTAAGPQHPNYDIQLSGSGDVILTDLGSTASAMVFEPTVNGRVFVRDAFGHLIAEVDTRGGSPVEIGLRPGQYDLTLNRDPELFAAQVSLSDGEMAPVGAADFVPVPAAVANRTRGGTLIEPYDPEESKSETGAVSLIPGISSHGWAVFDGRVTGGSFSFIGGVHRSVSGFEASMGFNIETERFSGFQYAPMFNLVTGPVKGTQISHGWNWAESGDVLQLGLVNTAGNISGLQLGIINVADELDGEALGFVNVIGNGYKSMEFWSSDTTSLNLGGKLGSRHLYGIFSVGFEPDESRRTLSFGAGLGGHIPAGPVYIDIDLMANIVIPDANFEAGALRGSLNKFRVVLGVPLSDEIALFAGATANVWVGEGELNNDLSLWGIGSDRTTTDPEIDVRVWPGAVVGLRFF